MMNLPKELADSDFQFSTLAIATSSVKAGFDNLAAEMDERINFIVGDLIEPLEMY